MFQCVEKLLAATRVKAVDVDFIIVNCSLFCPTPSLPQAVARKFNFRPDVRTYNLGGMGCSAGVISIDLAKQLLQNRPSACRWRGAMWYALSACF
jgi:3-ketoacyl-CoA synthase